MEKSEHYIIDVSQVYFRIAYENYDKYLTESDVAQIITAIVFEAMAVEAYINFIGEMKLGKSYFKEHIDELSTLNKIVVIPHLVAGKKFPKDINLYGKLQELFSMRNKLVHTKVLHIDLYEHENPFEKGLGYVKKGKFKSIVDVAENVIGSYFEFKRFLEDDFKIFHYNRDVSIEE